MNWVKRAFEVHMTETAPQVPPTVTLARENRHTHHFLVAYYLLAELWGVRSIWYWESSRLDILVPLVLSVALGWWAVVDAKRRGHVIPMFAQPWFVLLAPVLVPVYVIWTRRWPGVGWLVLHVVLSYSLATISMHLGGLLVFGGEWLRAFDL
jgi:hypothetical protein